MTANGTKTEFLVQCTNSNDRFLPLAGQFDPPVDEHFEPANGGDDQFFFSVNQVGDDITIGFTGIVADTILSNR